ncbi:MAG: protein kinase, partial [Deltaproteobacteria bacterium]|nr:protein kinase [Deltaproteobacteria bacterium]
MTEDDDIGSAQTMVTRTPEVRDSVSSIAESMPSVIAERYEVLGLLGVGGMGRVYRVRDRRLDEVVALKVLRRELADAPGVLDRFRQEVRLARRVTSPHVVRTFDLGEHGGDHFLTMELVDGQSLAQLLDAGPVSLDAALRIARAACAGIAAAHDAGVLHRDLKPDNILVARDGRIAITDFGIAHARTDPRATGEGFVGTPAYMAPEQLDTSATIGPAADLYALGAILFEMITERRPFPGTDPFAVALARLHRPPPDPRDYRDVPAPLAELVLRCLARDPAARPANAASLAALLDSIAATPAPAPAAMRPIVPAPNTSRAVAFLPLRATGDLVELADGLSEEIVDALTMTRELRIRPITAVRAVHLPDRDARETGKLLDVDVVVEGSMRRRGELVRISARAIGVTDGFQLWANHFDTAPSGLLDVGDQVAQAVARALTVEIDLPARIMPSATAVELYLEAKAKLRAQWYTGAAPVIPALEQARQLAPDHPGIVATLAMAVARAAFFTSDGGLPRARALAEQAIALAPNSGEAWFALGLAQLYANDVP